MNVVKPKYYFVGVGGIGMSALARYFNSQGCLVQGYDKTPTKLTSQLEKEGIQINFKDSINYINEEFKVSSKDIVIVYTPAVPEDNAILSFFKEKNFKVKKRAKILAEISSDTFSLAVAGTHGKTTTASILAHLMHESPLGCNAFLGGLANNYNSNVIVNEKSKYTVLEADEYDRSFLALSPSMAIITSVDPDHLDIYSDSQSFTDSFIAFANKIKPEGLLICQHSFAKLFNTVECRIITYGLSQQADIFADNIQIKNGKVGFRLNIHGKQIPDFLFVLPGNHNIENALAAIAIADTLEISMYSIKNALNTYMGVYRRFQVKYRSHDVVYIDDYAHHPTEISAVHQAVRQLFPDKKITCIFQPHLFSRTKDFMDDFARELSRFDEIILLEIYPAREKPMPGVTSESLLESITNANKSLFAKEVIVDQIINKELEVLLTLGAGDIDTLIDPLTNSFITKYNNLNSRN